MRTIKRTLLTVAALGLTAGLTVGLTACGGGRTAGGGVELTAEEQALGMAPAEAVGAAPSASADPKDRKRHHHRLLGKRVLHGELVVSTEDGPKTILVQRGQITAVDDDSMTVKSADGYTLTWTFDKDLRVVERRGTVDGDALEIGERVGVAGGRSGGNGVARLILINPPA